MPKIMILRLIQIVLGIMLVLVGLFLLFALAFNGSVGEWFVNYSFFASSILIIACGITKIANRGKLTTIVLGFLGVIFYLPMIWQRFNFGREVNTDNITFDIILISGVLVASLLNPKKRSN